MEFLHDQLTHQAQSHTIGALEIKALWNADAVVRDTEDDPIVDLILAQPDLTLRASGESMLDGVGNQLVDNDGEGRRLLTGQLRRHRSNLKTDGEFWRDEI